MQAEDALMHSGLDSKERAIYMALLKLGESPVLAIAKEAEVKRPTTYVVLSTLESKGFVSRVLKGKKVFFAPQHPKKILVEAELRLKEMKDAIPQLESMMQQRDNRPRVTVYEGKSQLDKAYDEAFLIEGEVVALSNSALVQEVFARTLQKVTYKASEKFRTRELLDDSETSRVYASKHAGPYWQPRIMPKEFSPFETDIAVFENTTLITSAKKEYFTVKLESEEIANTFRALFEAMWQISKPVAGE
jgi:sugar-specific transcriptional regulator TrmB